MPGDNSVDAGVVVILEVLVAHGDHLHFGRWKVRRLDLLGRTHRRRHSLYSHRWVCMRAWAVVGVPLTGLCAETRIFHPDSAAMLVIGWVVFTIKPGEGSNALLRGKRVVALEARVVGGRHVAYDAIRHAFQAATAHVATTVAPTASVGPCGAAVAAAVAVRGLESNLISAP